MSRNLALLLLLPLAACASDGGQPVLTTQTVYVPVVKSCVPSSLAPAPTYPDTDEALRAAPDGAHRYQLEHAGRKLRIARLRELEPLVQGCK
jgi:hypothetical protein